LQATDLILHWGVREGKQEWVMPPKAIRPPRSEEAGDIALESAFVAAEEKSEVQTTLVLVLGMG